MEPKDAKNVTGEQPHQHDISPAEDHHAYVDDSALASHGAAHYGHDAGVAAVEQGHIIPMDGERKVTKKSEIISYCLFYVAITGLGPFNYMPAQLQNLLTQAFPNNFVQWGGQTKSISALILDLNGIQFAVQLVLLLMIGPYADYGTWRPYILIVFTVISWGVGFGWLGLMSASKWQVAAGLYVVATVCFNLANTFYFSAFPGLVRDLPKMIESEREVAAGTKSAEAHAELDMQERSKLSNYSLATSASGSCIILVLGLSICFGIGTDTLAQNTKVYSVLIGYFTAVWVIFSMPWFLSEQYRPGQKIPRGINPWTIGPRQLWQACKSVWQLKWTFLYLISFFLLNDVYNVSGTAVNLLQNDAISFNTKQFTYLFILAYGTQGLGAFGIAQAQRWLGFSAKTGCIFGASCLTFTCLWGFIGIFTDKIGYHHVWEFYFYQAVQGIGVAGWNTYQNTVISEVVPAPKMYLFFALFYIVGKTSAFVGPFIASAIIDDSNGNTSASFWFTFFSGLTGVALLILVDIPKAKIACAKYLEKEAAELYSADELGAANEKAMPVPAPFSG